MSLDRTLIESTLEQQFLVTSQDREVTGRNIRVPWDHRLLKAAESVSYVCWLRIG